MAMQKRFEFYNEVVVEVDYKSSCYVADLRITVPNDMDGNRMDTPTEFLVQMDNYQMYELGLALLQMADVKDTRGSS